MIVPFIYILNNGFFSSSFGYSENIAVNIFQRASSFWVPNKQQVIKGLVF